MFTPAPIPALMTAVESTDLRVGTLVLDNDYKHPVVLAKEAATIDVLSEGRLELGVGAGPVLLLAAVEEPGVHAARREHGDADPAGELRGEGPGEADHAELAGAVGGGVGERPVAERRGDGGHDGVTVGTLGPRQRHGQIEHIGRDEEDRAFDERHRGEGEKRMAVSRQAHGPVVESLQHGRPPRFRPRPCSRCQSPRLSGSAKPSPASVRSAPSPASAGEGMLPPPTMRSSPRGGRKIEGKAGKDKPQ